MANVGDAASDIRNVVTNWMDANDLDETLEQLHEIPRVIQEAFSHYAEQLRENSNLRESIPEIITEAANDMAGIADKLQEAIRFGVQRS